MTHHDQKLHLSRLLSGDLSHFLTRESERIGFAHKRFAEMLSSKENYLKKYYISKRNGHVKISKYWIENLKQRLKRLSRKDIIYVFYHVANCKEIELQKTFREVIRSLRQTRQNTTLFQGILHETVARLNSYQTVKLLIDTLPDLQVDGKDEQSSPASYIAAAYGNAKSLKALLDFGANKSLPGPPIQ